MNIVMLFDVGRTAVVCHVSKATPIPAYGRDGRMGAWIGDLGGINEIRNGEDELGVVRGLWRRG